MNLIEEWGVKELAMVARWAIALEPLVNLSLNLFYRPLPIHSGPPMLNQYATSLANALRNTVTVMVPVVHSNQILQILTWAHNEIKCCINFNRKTIKIFG